ncbi:hypothetical protein DFH28DRAFT_922331 [Melampsora americana]|nr:hypothetical protein DFH28DRAFT_922331 [Melampsora americana]
MQPFNPFSPGATAQLIREFLQTEFPYVTEAAVRTRKEDLQTLAQKWIDIREQAETTIRAQGPSQKTPLAKPKVKGAICKRTKGIEHKSTGSSSKPNTEKPRTSGSSSTTGVSTSLPFSASTAKNSLLEEGATRPVIPKSAQTVSVTKRNKEKVLPDRRMLPYDKNQRKIIKVEPPSPNQRKIVKLEPPSPNQRKIVKLEPPSPNQRKIVKVEPSNSSTSVHKRRSTTKDPATLKSNQTVAATESLALSSTQIMVPQSSNKKNGVSGFIHSLSRHKRDMNQAFSDTRKKTALSSEKESIGPIPKRSKATSSESTTDAKTQDPINPYPKRRVKFLTPSLQTRRHIYTSQLEKTPHNSDQHCHVSQSDPPLPSDTSSLTPINSPVSSCVVEDHRADQEQEIECLSVPEAEESGTILKQNPSIVFLISHAPVDPVTDPLVSYCSLKFKMCKWCHGICAHFTTNLVECENLDKCIKTTVCIDSTTT